MGKPGYPSPATAWREFRQRPFQLSSSRPVAGLEARLLTPVEARPLRMRNWDIVGILARGDYRVIGWRRNPGLWLMAQENLRKHSFTPIFKGSIEVHEKGSLLTGRIGPPLFARGNLASWFLFITAFAIVGIAITINAAITGDGFLAALPFSVGPLVMLAFGYFFILVDCVQQAQKDRAVLERWITERLGGLSQ